MEFIQKEVNLAKFETLGILIVDPSTAIVGLLDHFVSGEKDMIPLAGPANKMGRIAGANAAGRRERFRGVMGTSIGNLRDVDWDLGRLWSGDEAARLRKEIALPT